MARRLFYLCFGFLAIFCSNGNRAMLATVCIRVDSQVDSVRFGYARADLMTDYLWQSVPIDQSGQFQFQMNLNHIQEIAIDVAGRSFYLLLGPNTYISIAVKGESISITKSRNDRGNSKYLAFQREFQVHDFQPRSLDVNQIEEEIDTYRRRILDDWKDKKKYVKSDLYDYVYNSCEMDLLAKRLRLKKLEMVYAPPTELFFTDSISIDRPAAIGIRGYYDFLTQLFQTEFSRQHFSRSDSDRTYDPNEAMRAYLYDSGKNRLSGHARSFFLANMLSIELYFGQLKFVEERFPDFCSISTIAEYEQELRRSISKFRKLSPGMVAPAVMLTDSNGTMLPLTSFHGKVVILKFWASWCAPCIQSIPSFQEAQDSLSTAEVAFVNVSVDDKKGPWLSAIKKHHLQGYNFIAYGRQSDVADAFSVKGVPAYFIIDKKGLMYAHLPHWDTQKVLSEVRKIL